MSKRILLIGSDHAGFLLKSELIQQLSGNYEFIDKGCFGTDSVDYPDFGHAVASGIENKEAEFGIVICGSGNGINMTANKHNGCRSALCWMPEIAALARQHNDANILALPARYLTTEQAIDIVNAFLTNNFEGGRHQNRINKI